MASFSQFKEFSNFNQVVDHQAQSLSDKEAFRFLGKKKGDFESLTFGELKKRIENIAYKISNQISDHQSRIIICLNPGMDYITHFLACIYAGKIAVPVHPPAGASDINNVKIQNILEDCNPHGVITTDELWEKTSELFKDLKRVNTQYEDEEKFSPIMGEIAFLQYTSGTTGNPKGVIVRHDNLINNLYHQSVAYAEKFNDGICVNWLPPFHDMGLIGMILCPYFNGYTCISMAPFSFLFSPLRWLEVISEQEKPVVTAAPNFALDLCCKRIKDDKIENLDLSKISVLYCGAEFIHESTLNRFATKFRKNSFSIEQIVPCYGMAEATLLVTQRRLNDPISFSWKENNEKMVNSITDCGPIIDEHSMIIVDKNDNILPEGEVGEICIHGPSIAQGYWSKPINSVTVEEKIYLKTGDLGFIEGNSLFPLGRTKELIIIQGQNFYPVDLEEELTKRVSALNDSVIAAFSVTKDRAEKLFFAIEGKELDQNLVEEIASSVLKTFSIEVESILLVPRNSLPRTTSGKIQRSKISRLYQASELNITQEFSPETKRPIKLSKEEFLDMAIESLEGITGKKVDPDQNFNDYEVDSIIAAELLGELQQKTHKKMGLEIFYNHQTLRAVVDFIFS